MSLLQNIVEFLRGLFLVEQSAQELDEELRGYTEAAAEEKIKDGMSAEDARRAARLELGGAEAVKEEVRASGWEYAFETVWQDVRFGARMLRKSPGFTAVAILTLALGIGANTAIFSLTYQVLLRDLPVANPAQLVIFRVPGDRVGHISSDSEDATSFSYPLYKDLRDNTSVFSGLIARFGVPLSVAGDDQNQLAKGELVSGNYFDVLGVRPALGRVLSQDDDTTPNGNPVAVLSYRYWTQSFGNDEDMLNKTLMVNGTALTVVGVAQRNFSGVQIGRPTDIFIPISMKARMTPGWDGMAARNDAWLSILGRLKPGLSAESAQKELAPVFRAIEESELPVLGLSYGSKRATQYVDRPIQLLNGEHGRPILQSNAETPLFALFTMVGLILLVACTNLAGLLLARGEARQRELALRLALGARRWRLIKQLLTESVLLALAGGIAGVLLALWTLRILVSSVTQEMGVSELEMRMDSHVLIFAMTVSILTAILFGLGPAMRVTRANITDTLKDQGIGASSGTSNVTLRKWLMVTQVALTATLLASAGYFSKNLVNLERQNLGVRLDHVVQFTVRPTLSGYTVPRTIALFDRIREEVAALPGVLSVSAAQYPSFEEEDWGSNITLEGYTAQPDEEIDVFRNSVGPGYFSTMGIPLVAGRDFRDGDSTTSPKVVVINEKMAQKYFAGRNPLGRHMAWGSGNSVHPDSEIVGVVQNSKYENLRDTIHPFVYQPYAQSTRLDRGTFYMRTSQDPAALTATLRSVMQRLDMNLPVLEIMTLQKDVERSVFFDRALTVLSLWLALLAAVLAAVGLYGVLAYIVSRRTKEIGIRIAVGATKASVAWLILQEVLSVAGAGLAIGLVAAFALGSFVQARLFGVRASDPLVFLATTALLTGVVVLAAWLPTRKAANLDPMVALRHE